MVVIDGTVTLQNGHGNTLGIAQTQGFRLVTRASVVHWQFNSILAYTVFRAKTNFCPAYVAFQIHGNEIARLYSDSGRRRTCRYIPRSVIGFRGVNVTLTRRNTVIDINRFARHANVVTVPIDFVSERFIAFTSNVPA